ncbi:MAG: copper chaperone PCu(A)C [Proteobacteria bacterium]|nr:copper chaperone PCu(A)C [Pseudomonadota bacterium]MBS0492468.1 copper chaperone PCu(A)C [Pseudomonadota bacterium]
MPIPTIAKQLTLAAALLAAGFAHAQVNVQDAWVRATVPQQKATGAFMRLTAAQDTRLVGASSPAAGVTEVHEMTLVDNVMKMRAIPVLDLPAGQAVELKPGGYHVMLMDLKQPVAAGSNVPLTLVFEGKDGQRQTQELQVPVRALGAAAAPAAPAAGHGKHSGH